MKIDYHYSETIHRTQFDTPLLERIVIYTKSAMELLPKFEEHCKAHHTNSCFLSLFNNANLRHAFSYEKKPTRDAIIMSITTSMKQKGYNFLYTPQENLRTCCLIWKGKSCTYKGKQHTKTYYANGV